MQVQGLLIESMVILQINNRGKWFLLFPHYLADLCAKTDDIEKKHNLFNYVIYASLASDTVSAVQRLLRGEQKSEFVEFVSEYRKRTEAMYSRYPPWVKGKLRGLMASLHII